MNTSRAFKNWRLREDETLTSFEDWKNNILYSLKQDKDFAAFTKKGVTWTKTKTNPTTRGLVAVGDKTAEDRVEDLDQMLGCIASFCPVIKKSTIIDNSRCLEDVWQAIRLHFGFHTSGANFLDFTDIKLLPNERHETLYQRMASFIDDNLLKTSDTITHDGEHITENEVISPSLENLVVLLWLEKLHPKLPTLVKQRYATQLRSKTLFSLKPEISMAIPSLLEETKNLEDARCMRLGGNQNRRGQSQQQAGSFNKHQRDTQRRTPECCLCKQAGREETSHWLSTCKFFPVKEKKFFARTRQIMGLLQGEDSEFDLDLDLGFEREPVEEEADEARQVPSIKRVMIKTCPYFSVYYGNSVTTITLDCGAEADLIRYDVCLSLGIPIRKFSQATTQADGKTPLNVVGEVDVTFTRGKHKFVFIGLVVTNLDVEILGSVPFMDRNDVTPRCAKKQIILSDNTIIPYQAITKATDSPSIRRACLLRADKESTLWPGDFVEVKVENDYLKESEVAIEPRISPNSHSWVEPAITKTVDGTIRLTNYSGEPHTIKKHDHLGVVTSTYIPAPDQTAILSEPKAPKKTTTNDHTSEIVVDPDKILSDEMRSKFIALHKKHNSVFDPNYKGYNHSFGRFEAVVNMGTVLPPQRKGKLPQYSRDKLSLVQEHFDHLEKLGVLAKPETVGVNIEYLNPSFLVKKGENSFRLVTAFTEVGKYCKPQPTLLPTVDSTLRAIARWNYIITTDLKSAYFQIPLSKDSMKYCGTVSPFKGSRVYTRCAMGMPGSETALEELLSRIIGDLIMKGIVTKQADDLYVGGETDEELFENWVLVLEAFDAAGIKLTAPKTIIAPTKALILGWIWKLGNLEASPHKIAALSKCERPVTVKDMRSYLGAYKVLSRVIPKCSIFLKPLNQSTSSKSSNQKIEWTEELNQAFKKSQEHLKSNKTIVLPKENDQLFIVTDGATTNPSGLSATLYVNRNNELKLAGFFSQQLKKNQAEKWWPCEVEGLAIAAAVKFFNGYIAQSKHRTKVITDSKPCKDAYNLLSRGEFSSNARLSTFLNTVSRYHISIDHLSGLANAPSDFGSRNPVQCVSDKCQVCLFTTKLDASVVRSISIVDVKNGKVQLPFTNRKAWIETQSECPDLRRVKAQLMQGTRPSKKETTIPNVKRYLNKVTIASDGLLVVKKSDPLSPSREAIVVPQQVLPGLVTAFHIRFEHPTSNELLAIMERSFFALNLGKTITETSSNCHLCVSLAKIPKSLTTQSTSDPPATFGSQFACDVLRRERQKILIVREYISSFTLTSLIASEEQGDLRTALLKLLVGYIPLDGPLSIVRSDPAPGLKALENDALLKKHRIVVDVGRIKNLNKNPVAERAVQEIEEVITRMETHNEALNDISLAVLTARLNNKIRSNGLSSREILMQRDQYSNVPIPINDKEIILEKHARAINDHESSEKSKSGGNPPLRPPIVDIGDLVHLYNDKDKHHPRSRYIVTGKDGIWLQIRKFSGSQLRTLAYKVKLEEVFKVPSQCSERQSPRDTSEEDEPIELELTQEPTQSLNQPTDPIVNDPIPEENVEIPTEILTPPNDNDIEDSTDTQSTTEDVDNEPDEESIGGLRRSERIRHRPPYLADYKL